MTQYVRRTRLGNLSALRTVSHSPLHTLRVNVMATLLTAAWIG
jgi:hypothetical protein